jgi:hypothetical protein
MVARPLRNPPDSAELITWAADAFLGVESRSTSCSEARKVAANDRVCSACSGNSAHSGGE